LRADRSRGASGRARARGGGRLSLIDDALKRAQEAGASEARASGSAERPWTPTPMPDPGIARAARLRRFAGLLCLALAAVGVGYLLLRGAGSSAPLPEKNAAAAPTAVPVAVPAEAPTALPVVLVPTPPRVRRVAQEGEAAPQQMAPAASV